MCGRQEIPVTLSNGSVYDYGVDPVSSASLVPWSEGGGGPDSEAQFTYKKDQPFFSLFVPTVDTIRASFILSRNIEMGCVLQTVHCVSASVSASD